MANIYKKYNEKDYLYNSFKTKIYPTSEQKEYFENCFGISRFAYNWFIYTRENNYKKGINKTPNQLFKEFMDMKNNNKEYEFLKNINSKIIKAALLDAKTAYENWFNEQNRKPKYKTKKDYIKSFNSERVYIKYSNSFKKFEKYFDGYHFYIGGGENLKFGVNKDNPTSRIHGLFIKTSEKIDFLSKYDINKITISFNGNSYFASFQYKRPINSNLYCDHKNNIVGIDLGLKTYATQSDGKIAKFPKRKILKLEKKIEKMQRILSHKRLLHEKKYGKKSNVPYSNNYYRVKTKLNKYFNKIKYIRNDFIEKYTTWLCKNYKIIKVENLNILGMIKNHRMAKSIYRVSWGFFKLRLHQKSNKYNNKIIEIDRFYPSSKICSSCGNKIKKISLGTRTYICKKCGLVIDRDLNAAINIAKF